MNRLIAWFYCRSVNQSPSLLPVIRRIHFKAANFFDWQILTAVMAVLFAMTMNLKAETFYVSPSGQDTNDGNLNAPFATIQRAQKSVKPGDTVLIRGGVYKITESQIAFRRRIWAYVSLIDKSGAKGKRINYWAYPGEKPVFDFSAVKPAGQRVIAFQVNASWVHFKGIEVVGVQVTMPGHTQSECFENQGSNNIYEQLVMRDGMAIGIYLTRGSNNLFLNCDAFRNYDSISEKGKGGNTDGFGCHPSRGSTGNIFRGCRAWNNSDDGYDLIMAMESVTFDNCWAMKNGVGTPGDGNGFKAGGYGTTNPRDLPIPIPRHVIQFCVAAGNKSSGFYSNHHPGGSTWINNSAYGNRTNFNMLNRLPDNVTDIPGTGHKMRNNLGISGRNQLANLNAAASDVANNYFNLAVEISRKDFVTLEEDQLISPRRANGDLPKVDFMRLVKGSDLVDKGVDVGFPFKGKAPDLGAFEQE